MSALLQPIRHIIWKTRKQSRYSCAFCIGCKIDPKCNFSTKNGIYKKGEMRTWDHTSEQNDLWLEETAGNRTKLKNYYNCEFKTILHSL